MVATRTRRIPAVLVAAFAVWTAGAVPAQAEDAPPAGKLSGRIVDAEREPLAGARVALYRDDTDAQPRRWVREREPMTTDESGAYEFAEVPKGWYVVFAARDGFAKTFRYFTLEAESQLTQEFVLRAPVASVVTLRDEDGRPVAGATLRNLNPRDENGEFWYRSRNDWETFGTPVPPSDEAGRIQLPELPEGSTFTVIIDHPDFAPIEVKDVKAGPKTTTEAVMKPGTAVTLKIAGGDEGGMISEAEIRLFHDPFDHPSSVFYHHVRMNDEGVARMTVEAGRYSLLRLTHADYYILPEYSPRIVDGEYLRIGDSANEEFRFQLIPKVTVRGRVVDASGKPLAKMFVLGQVPNGEVRRISGTLPAEEAPDDWAHVDFVETNEQGEYTLELTAGPARVSFGGQDYASRQEHLEVVVAADGSTVVPELVLHPMPTVAGKVVDANENPVAGAVVRFRGRLRHMQPTKTDDQGRFTLKPTWMPTDPDTDEQQPEQSLVAFHPYERLGASTTVALNKPDSLNGLTLTLEPQEPDAFLDGFREESTPAERGEVGQERLAENAANALIGEPAPPLDGTWLNTEEPSEGLAAFRGKYVLLDFWFIGCGPCHADYPSVQLLHDLYKDRGVVVIAVHNNSSTAEAVRQFVEKEEMRVPILVDEPDGRTIARYEGRGLRGYPSHLLIGPDGTVIDDDESTPGPSLRAYKIELIRELLLRQATE